MHVSFKNDPAHIIPENFENPQYKVIGFRLIWKSLYVTVVFTEDEVESRLPYKRVLYDMIRTSRRL